MHSLIACVCAFFSQLDFFFVENFPQRKKNFKAQLVQYTWKLLQHDVCLCIAFVINFYLLYRRIKDQCKLKRTKAVMFFFFTLETHNKQTEISIFFLLRLTSPNEFSFTYCYSMTHDILKWNNAYFIDFSLLSSAVFAWKWIPVVFISWIFLVASMIRPTWLVCKRRASLLGMTWAIEKKIYFLIFFHISLSIS